MHVRAGTGSDTSPDYVFGPSRPPSDALTHNVRPHVALLEATMNGPSGKPAPGIRSGRPGTTSAQGSRASCARPPTSPASPRPLPRPGQDPPRAQCCRYRGEPDPARRLVDRQAARPDPDQPPPAGRSHRRRLNPDKPAGSVRCPNHRAAAGLQRQVPAVPRRHHRDARHRVGRPAHPAGRAARSSAGSRPSTPARRLTAPDTKQRDALLGHPRRPMTSRAVSENLLTETCRGPTASLKRRGVDRHSRKRSPRTSPSCSLKRRSTAPRLCVIASNITKQGIRLCHPSRCSARLTCSDGRFRSRARDLSCQFGVEHCTGDAFVYISVTAVSADERGSLPYAAGDVRH